jgi:hypothetical protein
MRAFNLGHQGEIPAMVLGGAVDGTEYVEGMKESGWADRMRMVARALARRGMHQSAS